MLAEGSSKSLTAEKLAKFTTESTSVSQRSLKIKAFEISATFGKVSAETKADR